MYSKVRQPDPGFKLGDIRRHCVGPRSLRTCSTNDAKPSSLRAAAIPLALHQSTIKSQISGGDLLLHGSESIAVGEEEEAVAGFQAGATVWYNAIEAAAHENNEDAGGQS